MKTPDFFTKKNTTVTTTSSRPFTAEEEIVNTIIHGAGVLFGLIAMPILINAAAKNNDLTNIMRVAIYGFSFLATFTFSTLYHGWQNEKIKTLLEKFDRISIYFFIAGSYTPFILYYMHDRTGMILLTTIWVFVLLGILYEIYLVNRFVVVSVFFYLLMGWMFAFVSKQFFAAMPASVVILVLTGIFLYSVGVVFFVWQKWRFHHAIWHAFVLAASICHYIAVLKTVM